MKKNILFIVWVALFSLFVSNSQAQSLKDLLNRGNISKVVNAVTGTPETIDMTGTWAHSGSTVESGSDNLLIKAGRAIAATIVRNRSNEQSSKVGTREGQMSFAFNTDNAFTNTVGEKKLSGTYSYNASTKQVGSKYSKLLNLHTEANCTSNSMGLLFNSGKLPKLMTFLGSKTNSTALRTVSSLAENYDGMMLGFGLKK